MMALFRKTTQPAQGEVDFTRLPRHIAIIMDGNGRWAKKRGLPRTAGHPAGAETLRTIATYCKRWCGKNTCWRPSARWSGTG